MTAKQFIAAQLALLAWREAGRYGLNPMLAIGELAANRVQAGWHGGNWLAIIGGFPIHAAHETASGAAGEAGPGPETDESGIGALLPDVREPNFVLLLEQIDGLLRLPAPQLTLGAGPDGLACGALYACDHQRPLRPWFRKTILEQPDEHPRLADVGPLSFFR